MSTVSPPSPSIGLSHTDTLVVAGPHTAPQVESSWPGFVDMRPYLTAWRHTVGTHVDISHLAARPVGIKVTATVELTAIDGKVLVFKVESQDESGIVGAGTHRSAIVDLQKFVQRVEQKSRQARP